MNNYRYDNGCTYAADAGEMELLANFQATITHETKHVDGMTQRTILTITGVGPDDAKHPPIKITADEFSSMAWVMREWGTAAVIEPRQSCTAKLRAAIQTHSKPIKRTIYGHTGWTRIGNRDAWLTTSGAITATGLNKEAEVQLPADLARYAVHETTDVRTATRATLEILKVAPKSVTWPLVAATIAAVFGESDFGIHLSGRTGTYKSELASLCQSHYGPDMDARHLPGQWSSTGNALEAQAYRIKDALFSIDDFIPSGSRYQQQSYQKNADTIFRGLGNQGGRARLTDTSSLQTSMYPRGIVLSTGEDIPEGHSIRGRILILEISPGEIDLPALTKAQAARIHYPATIYHLVKHLAGNLANAQQAIKESATSYRDAHLGKGHSRTPGMLGRLMATTCYWLHWAASEHAITELEAHRGVKDAYDAIVECCNEQDAYLTAADPVTTFTESIRTLLQAHIAHVRSKDGGIPLAATQLGWTAEQSSGCVPTYKAHGKCIAWSDWDRDELYIDMNVGVPEICRHAKISTTKQTLLKRFKDAGILLRCDDTRIRNAVRVNCEGTARLVIVLSLSETLQIQEIPNA